MNLANAPEQPLTDEQIQLVVIKNRDRQMGDVLTLWIGIAAEVNPDVLRTALGKVFDLRAVEADHRRIAADTRARTAAAEEAVLLLQSAHKDIEALEQHVDGLKQALAAQAAEYRKEMALWQAKATALEKRLEAMAERVEGLEKPAVLPLTKRA